MSPKYNITLPLLCQALFSIFSHFIKRTGIFPRKPIFVVF
jgi:hypothetical protein